MKIRRILAAICAVGCLIVLFAACSESKAEEQSEPSGLATKGMVETPPEMDNDDMPQGVDNNPFVITGTLQNIDNEGNIAMLDAQGNPVAAKLEPDAEIAVEYVDEKLDFVEENSITLAEALDLEVVSAVVMGGYEGDVYMVAQLMLRVQKA